MDGQFFPGQAIQFEGGFVRPPWYKRDAQFLIDKMGLGTGLIYTLDPGEVTSYDPDTDAQALLDLSGNGNDFNVGATSGSEASDPTFNGTKGALTKNEYFGLDGGDYLTVASMPAALETFHKDSAVGTIAGWFYYAPDGVTTQGFFGSGLAGSTGLGMKLVGAAADGTIRLQGGNGAGASIINQNSGIVLNSAVGTNLWVFIAAAFDEAANSLRVRANDVTASTVCTYSSPSASDVGAFSIGAVRSGGIPLANGSRIGPQWAWSRQLSAAEIENLYVASRVRGWLS